MSLSVRLKNLQNILQKAPNDAILFEDPISLLYLTGLHLSSGKLLVTRRQACLIVDGRYIEGAQQQSLYPVQLHSDDAFATVLKEFNVSELGFAQENTSYKRYLELVEAGPKAGISLKGVENPLKQLRMIKDSEELDLLREAAHLGSRGYDLLCDLLEEGVREQDLAQDLQLFWIRQGGQQLAFEPIIAFGASTSRPHYRAGKQRLVKGQPVLIDIGVTLNSYHSDMTRVVFFGEPAPKMLEIYNIVLEAQQAALDLCRPGTRVGALDDAARSLITKEGYGEIFSHSLGHGIGLEVHEIPTLRNKPPHESQELLPGMVITIEPGIYLPGVGGVRIEDTIIITDSGFEDLTQRSKEIRIIE